MSTNSLSKTITLTIYNGTFADLEFKSRELGIGLNDIYLIAINEYLSKNVKMGRLRIFGTPGAGKRIRVIIDEKTYNSLHEKVVINGTRFNDTVYTAFETYLDKTLAISAA